MSAEWSFRRENEPFHPAMNQREYDDIFLGPLEVTCATVVDFSDDTDLTVYRNSIDNQGQFATWFSADGLESADFVGAGD